MGRMFEVRKRTMFARWDRMAKAFTRCGREITIAVKAGGDDPDSNPALRRAIQNARSVNMPKDRIEGAIKRALGNDSADYSEVLYEGYGPHGIAVMVTAATDNPTRTVANLRVAFDRNGGNLGATGSVAYQFNHMGVFKLNPDGLDPEELELELIDYGAEDLTEAVGEEGEELLAVRCAFGDFGTLQAGLEEKGITPVSSGAEWVPQNTQELDEEQLTELLKLVDKLEQDDDVQQVFTNAAD